MIDDIVTRLRALGTAERPVPDAYYVSPDEAADEIERWRDLAIHAWVHMVMDATCSDDDCEQCQTIKKAWENK